MNFLGWSAPGPVAEAFLRDRSRYSAIMGPMGSGKTSTVLMKFVHMAAEQAVSPRANPDYPGRKVRYTKIGVVRETSTNLKRTTIKSIKNWFGPKTGKWYGGGSSADPLTYEVGFVLPDQTLALVFFEFIGLDGNNIEDLSKGWEITHYWLNEADLLSPDVKEYLDGRIGRYPSAIDGGASHRCGVMDYNAPDTGNYLYRIFEEEKLPGYMLFKQPGGRSPNAENLHNLVAGYYDDMVVGKQKWWVRRNVDNQYGFSREGDPVYESYRDDFHCAGYELEPVAGIPLKLYADAATHPAIVVTQNMPNGQRRIIDEIYIRGGAKQLADAVREHMARRYPGHRYIGGTADPSAAKMDDKDSAASNWIDTLSDALSLAGAARFSGAPTNDPVKRIDAVDELLTTTIDNAQPALLISPRAKLTRKGFNSDYCYKKRADGTVNERPTKDHWVSDVHDAIQYYALDDGGYETLMAREGQARRRHDFSRPRVARMEVRI